MIVPLSPWHIVLGWIDLFTDIMGASSTAIIAARLRPLCGMNIRPFFAAAFAIQTALIIGNLAAQAGLAAYHAAVDHAASKPRVRRRAIGMAIFRGVTNLELAHLEWSRNAAPSPARTAAVMRYKLAELVFEAPGVVVAWSVVLARLVVDELAWAAQQPPQPITEFTKVTQVSSAAFGIFSLSIALLDFLRLHPRSFWARALPPRRLFLALIDVSPSTWARSIAIGAFAFFSVATRAMIYIQLSALTVTRSFFDVRYNFKGDSAAAIAAAAAAGIPPTFVLPAGMPPTQFQVFDLQQTVLSTPYAPPGTVYQAFAYRTPLGGMDSLADPSAYYTAAIARVAGQGSTILRALLPLCLLAAFVANALLLLPMRSLVSLPAAFVSIFANIPWVAARKGSRAAKSPHAAWPSWVLAFVYLGPVMALYCSGFLGRDHYTSGFLGIDLVSPCLASSGTTMVRAPPGCNTAAAAAAAAAALLKSGGAGPAATAAPCGPPLSTDIPAPSGARLMLWGGRTTRPGANLAAFLAMLPMFATIELVLFLGISGASVRARQVLRRRRRLLGQSTSGSSGLVSDTSWELNSTASKGVLPTKVAVVARPKGIVEQTDGDTAAAEGSAVNGDGSTAVDVFGSGDGTSVYSPDPLAPPEALPVLLYRFSLWRPYFLSSYRVVRHQVDTLPGAGPPAEVAWANPLHAEGPFAVSGALGASAGGPPAERVVEMADCIDPSQLVESAHPGRPVEFVDELQSTAAQHVTEMPATSPVVPSVRRWWQRQQ